MRKFKQEKLWRNKVPSICEQSGSIINSKILNDAEFDEQLRIKLLEEAAEVQAAQTKQDLIAELADMHDVLSEIMTLHNIDMNAVEKTRIQKCAEKGSFSDRIYVTVAEHPAGSYSERYCLADPDKFPEIDQN